MTTTQIANIALAKLGTQVINSIDDANTKEARCAKLHFEQVRDEVLRSAFWSFARQNLAVEEETAGESETFATEILPWATAYALPADYLKLLLVRDGTTGLRIDKFEPRRVNSKKCLAANVTGGIILSYTARITDPDEWDPLFVNAVTTLLASRMARAVTGSEQLEGALLQRYLQEDLPAARCADAQDTQSAENHPLQDELDGTLTPRANFYVDFDDR